MHNCHSLRAAISHIFLLSYADYAHLYGTINNILDRCGKVQQRLGSSSSSRPSSSKLHSPTYISKRSRILFEAPSAAESPSTGSTESKSAAAAAAVGSKSDPGAANSRPGRYQQQVRPATWAGAVDINPGFSFPPGVVLTRSQTKHSKVCCSCLHSGIAWMCLVTLCGYGHTVDALESVVHP